ncbi:DgyrCDS14790 [Dimorphilus gyrociliatus]|uniref:DgyrCDS14790 n=1 Tax=Dimorphilus gyrociliatus TaxID=2664684 RepID=A0A7I8WEW2_9ANNE|nr:DgyrCDS14790 [Dimorphilus gyrociliatus]
MFWFKVKYPIWSEKYKSEKGISKMIMEIKHFGNLTTKLKSVDDKLAERFCLGQESVGKYNAIKNSIMQQEPKISKDKAYLVDGLKDQCPMLFKDPDSQKDIYAIFDLVEQQIFKVLVIYTKNDLDMLMIVKNSSGKNVQYSKAIALGTEFPKIFTAYTNNILGRYLVFVFKNTLEITICEIEIYTNNLAMNLVEFPSTLRKDLFSSKQNVQHGVISLTKVYHFLSIHLKGQYLVYSISLFQIYTTNTYEIYVKKMSISYYEGEMCSRRNPTETISNIVVICDQFLIGEFIELKIKEENIQNFKLKRIDVRGLSIGQPEYANIAHDKACWNYLTSTNPPTPTHQYSAMFASDAFRYFTKTKPFSISSMNIDLLQFYRLEYILIKTTSFQPESIYEHIEFNIIRTHDADTISKFGIKCKKDSRNQQNGDLSWDCKHNMEFGNLLNIETTNQLTILELYIFGKSIDIHTISADIAISRIASISNLTWNDESSSSTLLGQDFYNIETVEKYSSCSKITLFGNVLIRIKLRKAYYIHQIQLETVTDKNQTDSLNQLSLFVGYKNRVLTTLCGNITDAFVGTIIQIHCLCALEGNELIIVKNTKTNYHELGFSNIRILGRTSEKTFGMKIIQEKKLTEYSTATNGTLTYCLNFCKLNYCVFFSYNFNSKLCLIAYSTEIAQLSDDKNSVFGQRATLIYNNEC